MRGANGAAPPAPVEELLEDGERQLCLSRGELGVRDRSAALGSGPRTSEPGVLALTDRRMLFVGDGGGRLSVTGSELRAWRVRRRLDGSRDLWASTAAGTAVVRRVSPEVRDALGEVAWGAEAAPAPRSRHLLALATPVLAAAIWAVSVAGIQVEDVGALGLVSALPPAAFAALALLCVSFGLSISQLSVRTSVLALHVLALVFMLHGATALFEQVPTFNVTWRHAGISAYIAEHGGVDPSISAYFNWPGFFALSAAAGELAGLDGVLDLSRWAPLAFNLLYLPPLLLIARTVSDERRVPWAAAWVFYLASWVHQDYLSPQGLILLLYLGFVAIILRWLGRASPPERRARAALVGVCFILLLAAVPSHQLTPFAMLIAALALVAVGSCSARTLPAIAAVLVTAWLLFAAGPYLSGHLDQVKGSIGQLGATLSANVSSRVQGSGEHTLIAYARIGFVALIFMLAGVAALRHLRRGWRRWLPHVVLVLALFSLALLQTYGGEILLRIYLFTLPFVAALAASLLLLTASMLLGKARGRALATTFVAATSVVLAGLFLLARYGNDQVDLFTPGEAQLVQEVERSAPSGSVLVAPDTNLPWASQRVGELRFRTLEQELGAGDRGDLADAVASTIQGGGATEGYLLVTQNAREYEHAFGAAPWGTVAELVGAIDASPRFAQVRAGPDGSVYRLLPETAGQPG